MEIWRAPRSVLLRTAVRLIAAQQTLIHDQQAALDQAYLDLGELQGLILESHRATRDVAVGARLAAMSGVDILDDLDLLINDLSDSIANMEEHLVAR